MRAHHFPRVLLAGVLLLGLAGCQARVNQVRIENRLDVPVVKWVSSNPDSIQELEFKNRWKIAPGEYEWVYYSPDDPGFPWNIWPLMFWEPNRCADDLYMFVVAEDGREFVREPPLCADDGAEWVVSD